MIVQFTEPKNIPFLLAIVRREQRYMWVYDSKHQADVIRSMSRYACDPDLDFTWYDAAMLTQKVRKQVKEESKNARLKN